MTAGRFRGAILAGSRSSPGIVAGDGALPNALQAVLVAVVVLWVLDVPRQVFDTSFYTEQLLAVTPGLTLALAFVTEPIGRRSTIDGGGAIAVLALRDLPDYRAAALHEITLPALGGLAVATCTGRYLLAMPGGFGPSSARSR